MNKVLYGIIFSIFAAIIFFFVFFIKIPVTTIGVKQNMWGDGGIVKEDFDTGFAVGISGIHKWHYLDASTHFLNFSKEVSSKSRTYRNVFSSSNNTKTTGPLTIRTKDNNNAEIDVTVPYRIIKSRGHKIVEGGLKLEYPDRVKSTVESVLRANLAELSSEEWQITDTRLEQVKKTLDLLNIELDQFHVKAHNVLIRQIRFPSDYERKLQEKQLLRQKANLDEAMALQAKEEQNTNALEKQIGAAEKEKVAVWEKKIQEKRSEYEVLIAQIKAEALIYDQSIRSEGQANSEISLANGKLQVEKAEALWTQLRNKVLNTTGGRLIIARTAAENLTFKEIILNSNDPHTPKIIDLDEFTRILVGSKK